MHKEDIMKLLPHREPMLLLDEGELIDGVSQCKYTVRGNEYFLQGHFPGNPVVPGVILCEMMAQASCLLVEKDDNAFDNASYTPYFTGMDKIKFKKKVLPGDCIVLRSELLKQKGPFYFVKSAGYVDDAICCMGEISFALVKEQ